MRFFIHCLTPHLLAQIQPNVQVFATTSIGERIPHTQRSSLAFVEEFARIDVPVERAQLDVDLVDGG